VTTGPQRLIAKKVVEMAVSVVDMSSVALPGSLPVVARLRGSVPENILPRR